jgi:hypothetical protein
VVRKLLLVLALAAFAAPGAQGATSVTLVFTSYTTITKTLDKPPRGKPNAGDKIQFKDLLVATDNQLGKRKGKPVGYDAGTVLYTSAKAQSIQGVTTFPGYGTVTFGGAMKSMKDGTVHVPVLKGTGSFKGAHGTLIIGEGEASRRRRTRTSCGCCTRCRCPGRPKSELQRRVATANVVDEPRELLGDRGVRELEHVLRVSLS